jgi:hypothetical protein
MFTGFAEFWLCWRGCPVLSTLLIDVVSFGIVVFARFRIVGGSIVDEVSYRLASLATLG